MNTQFWVVQAFNGISYGALLFLVGSGLSLIFGVMRIVNLSHGAYFLWGGYIALSVIHATGSWALSLPVAALAVALIGLLMERVFLRPLGFDPLRQVLLTVGFAFLFQQAALDIWGGNNMDINPPHELTASVVIGGVYFPLYRMFMIGMALLIGLLLWLVMEKTRMGAAVRATVDDAQMARGVGIDTNRVSMFIFALGAFLAALGGVIGGAFLGIYPGLDFEMLPLAFRGGHHRRHGLARRRRHRRAACWPGRQFRQGAVPGSVLLHALRADGADPGDQADRPVRQGVKGAA